LTRFAVTDRLRLLGGLAASVALAFSVAASLLYPIGFRVALAAGLSVLVVGIGTRAPRHVLYALVVWLASLGLVRRLVSDVSPPGEADALLLVGPVAIGVLLLVTAQQEELRRRTSLATSVLILTVLVVAGALNPLQGGLLTGIAGLLFVLVPMLAFWVGRKLCDDATLTSVIKLTGVLAIPAALYGLAQVFVGFPPWDATWIRERGYESLAVFAADVEGQAYRPFASFSAASEFSAFLGVATVIWLGYRLMTRRAALAIGVLALLTVAILYVSARGVVLGVMTALGLMFAARRRLPLGAAFLVVVVFLAVPFTVGRVVAGSVGGGGVLVAHQLQGFSDPLDPERSTIPIHLSIVGEGVRSVTAEPLGVGVGAVTLAGSKFGDYTRGTEADVSNVAVALGIPGLLAYLVFVVIAFSRTYRVASARQDSLALVALGILTVTLLQWLNGGHYGVAFLPWLVLGWVERTSARSPEALTPP
jgi:hypothetical protein